MEPKHELYAMIIPRGLEIDILSKSYEPSEIVHDLWDRLIEGWDLDEAISLMNKLYDDSKVTVKADYIDDYGDNAPIKLSGEVRWLALKDVPDTSYYDGIIRSQMDRIKDNPTTEVLLQGDTVIAIIRCENNTWMGTVFVEEGYNYEERHKKALKRKIEDEVQCYLYPY